MLKLIGPKAGRDYNTRIMGHHHEHKHDINNGLSLAFWLNLVFSIVEVIGGILTNSTAIIADAFHDFMDAMAIGGAVLLEKVSGRKRTSNFSYGYRRFSLLAALGMSLFLLIGGGVMVYNAIESFIHPQVVDSIGMLWLAVLGVAINGFAFLRINRANDHSHVHVHGEGGHNHNNRAIMLHLLEDVLGWVAVLIGSAVIYFTGWYWIDGVLTLMIAFFIGYNATKNLISTMKVMLQSVPENVDVQKLAKDLNEIAGVKNVHDLHVWSFDGQYNVASMHAVVDASNVQSENNIYNSIIQLMEKHNIQHPTVQFETSIRNCSLANC